VIFLLQIFASKKLFAQMEFVQNKGQWNNKVNYKADFKTGAFFLENNGFTVLLNKPEDVVALSEYMHGHQKKMDKHQKPNAFHSYAYNVTFLGANEKVTNIPDKPLPTYNNYFKGNDKTKWAGDCKIYNAITYKNIYPNIDVRYYSTQDKLKYDFIVYPGGNPSLIAMRYDGVQSLKVKNNELVIGTTIGDVKELKPYSYQTNINKEQNVATSYVIKDNVVSFKIDNYDASATLVIDPQLIFSSLSRTVANNFGYTATPGADGSFFAGCNVWESGYPTNVGAFQTTFAGGGYDIGILKLTPNGTNRVYATYIGGSDLEQPHSLIAAANGNLIIAGRTNSPDYPLLTGIPATGTGYDIIVTVLNPTGTALLGSAKIGGAADDGVNMNDKNVPPFGDNSIRRNYGDDAKSEVILDASNNIILASCSQSNNFPLLSPFQLTKAGLQDGVILKLTPNASALIFSTYFGGTGNDACYVTAINPLTGNLYVGGATASNNLPGSTIATVNPSSQGGIDGFVTELQPNGSAIIKTTYIGTNGVDAVYGLKFDKKGFPYVMGTTTGVWVAINALYNVPNSKQFIAKLKPDLSAFIYSTNFGTVAATPNISPIAFLVDRCENVYVSGWGGDINFGYSNSGTSGLPSIDPFSGIQPPDGSDFYFFVLKKNAQAPLFASHFGQNGGTGDHVDGGTSRFDENGIIYQAICANCGDAGSVNFPTFPNNVWGPTNLSARCNLAAVKINMDFSGIATTIQSSINGVLNDTLGCNPILVTFIDTLQKGVKYFWNFDTVGFPNNTDTITFNATANHYYDSNGVYVVRLISEDSSTCNIRDTTYMTIVITERIATPKFRYQKIGLCDSKEFEFINQSFPSDTTIFKPISFEWDYGDGSPKEISNKLPNKFHTFPGPGTYFVKLKIIDDRFCNVPITDTQKVVIASNVIANTVPLTGGCTPYNPTVQNNSLNGVTYLWEFLNANTGAVIFSSTDFQPTFNFNEEGTYKYRLIAYNNTTCNLTDTTKYFTFSVLKTPTVNFDWRPKPVEINEVISFINLSNFATSYLWSFGDTVTFTSNLFEPTHIYTIKGNYFVTLRAFNTPACAVDLRLPIQVLASQLLDVPNAFTPAKFGTNSVVYVRGFGIGKMDWKIYNRWGELVFQSNDKKKGWDGYYKGKLQPTDVYTYTLDVEFLDGEKAKRTGDITLLR
jgi:gliding motility-associated-like protein